MLVKGKGGKCEQRGCENLWKSEGGDEGNSRRGS